MCGGGHEIGVGVEPKTIEAKDIRYTELIDYFVFSLIHILLLTMI